MQYPPYDRSNQHEPRFVDVYPRLRWIAIAWLATALLGCQSYDAALLRSAGDACGNGRVDSGETCDPAIPAGEHGACPDECNSEDRCAPAVVIGSGCRRTCAVRAITEAADGDGCCPAGAAGAGDLDCAQCGDGVVGPSETCDPPERCLTAETCVSPSPCVVATLTGNLEACNVRCELTPITRCQDGDACCPASCGQGNDSDCSGSCGDGVVAARFETCEPGSESEPCVADCDDHDDCTADVKTGSADNCNLSCTHTTITAPKDRDGCCPKGANAINDSDCQARCGNGTLEPGEECDGEPDCNERCIWPAHSECRAALASVEAMSDACKACACERCEDDVLACHRSGDAADDEACRAIVECAHRTRCEGVACYCGSSVTCNFPDGACKEEIETASGSNSPAAVRNCANTPSCTAAKAYAHATCLQRNCSAACRASSAR